MRVFFTVWQSAAYSGFVLRRQKVRAWNRQMKVSQHHHASYCTIRGLLWDTARSQCLYLWQGEAREPGARLQSRSPRRACIMRGEGGSGPLWGCCAFMSGPGQQIVDILVGRLRKETVPDDHGSELLDMQQAELSLSLLLELFTGCNCGKRQSRSLLPEYCQSHMHSGPVALPPSTRITNRPAIAGAE